MNPNGGHRTAYLWEQVWERESWLEILGRYLVAQKDKKKQITKIIFPRFHQLDATRKLQAAVLREGPGGKYLDPALGRLGQDQLDRVVRALPGRPARRAAQEAVRLGAGGVGPQRDRHAVAGGDLRLRAHDRRGRHDQGRRRAARAANWRRRCPATRRSWSARSRRFPSRSKAVRELAATQGKRFAVIADEAHSSQTGEAAAKLKAVLSAEELQELDDGGEVSTEDILAAQMAARAERQRASPTSRSPRRPRPRRWSCSARRPDPSRKPAGRTTCRARSTSIRCGRRSRRDSSSTCCRTTRPTSWPSSWRTTARRWTTRRSNAARP